MPLSLSNYDAIQTNLFVRLNVEYYKASPGDTASTQILTFSDRNISTSINGDTYVGLGNLLSITNSTSELSPSSGDLTITLSGIPNSSIAEIMNSRIKGSDIKVMRGIYNASTGTLLTGIGTNPINRFMGFVNNLSLNEDYDVITRTSSNTLVLVCSSVVDVLNNKVSGRKTNPDSQKKFFPSDISMDRVPTIESSYFDFGAK